ncbi:MAG TPA: methylated-DNA--[protein]-cysteine S-methyltransferase [Bacilli bacterium]
MVNYYQTKIGVLEIKEENGAITEIGLVKEIKKGEENSLLKQAFIEISEYLDGKRKNFTFNTNPKGTSFQKQVWNALLTIPYGTTCSYKDIAIKINNPKAYRAVGLANNKNPIMIVIPCHRVIGSNGKLVGYAGGLNIKEQLLKLERDNYESI